MDTKMKRKVKRAFVKALRSGDYKQGQGVLRDGDYFCADGVLCDLAVRAGAVEQSVAASGLIAYDGRIVSIPQSVARWSGLSGASAGRIAHLNDERWSFAALADLIEAEY